MTYFICRVVACIVIFAVYLCHEPLWHAFRYINNVRDCCANEQNYK